jgi:hypothetical protein
MQTLKHIIDKRILKIQRLDSQIDYEFYSPNAIVLTLSDLDNKLVLSIINDGISCDIKVMSDSDIENEFGLEFNEQTLNDLKKDDELNYFLNEKITNIKIAEFLQTEIKGENFVIQQEKYAGVKIETENHSFLFYNNYGGWIDINDNVVELPNPDRWQWTN